MNAELAVLDLLPHWAPSLVVCVVLVTIAAIMLRSQRRAWARRQEDQSSDQADLLHYQNQFRRRAQTSLLMGGIGILILVGDMITEQMGPMFLGVYWFGILLLVSYLIVLALLDALATTSHTKAALARLRAQQRQLQREAAEFRERQQTL